MTVMDLYIIFPELLLSITAMLALVFAAYFGKDALTQTYIWGAALLFVFCGLYIGLSGVQTQMAFGDMLVVDAFARFAKVVILLGAAAVLLMGQEYMQKHDIMRFEYPILIVFAVVGMMIMVSSADLLTLYMGLELQSLALYVVASLRRDNVLSTEAGLKYFVLGAFSSGLLLYGCALVYGFSGTTSFAGIAQAVQGGISVGLLMGLVLMLCALAFKISAAPFHMWTPDVYEGAPTPITAFFATAPKMAAMALFARVVHDVFGGATADWQQVVVFLSIVSMFVGAIAAIGQKDLKRLMAYSSISHMGFALMGLAAGTALGVQAMLVYMAIYVAMNIGSFAFILSLSREGQSISDLGALHLYARAEPQKALCVLLLMFSMAGVPPLVGFFGKFYVFRAALDAGLIWLVVCAAIASTIGAFYYIRIVYYMYFGDEAPILDRSKNRTLTAFLFISIFAITIGSVNLFGIEAPAQIAAMALAN